MSVAGLNAIVSEDMVTCRAKEQMNRRKDGEKEKEEDSQGD